MKRILIILFVLQLGGCAALDSGGTSILKGGTSITAPVANVTPRMVNDIENGAQAAVAGLVGYRRLCIAKTIDRSCRDTIATIQTYTRQLCSAFDANHQCAAGIIIDLRRFVAQNDQVNAIAAYKLIQQLIAGVQATRTAAGV